MEKRSKLVKKLEVRIQELVKVCDERRWEISDLRSRLERAEKESKENTGWQSRFHQVESENKWLRFMVQGMAKVEYKSPGLHVSQHFVDGLHR